MAERRLVSTRRTVDAAHRGRYDETWQAVGAAAARHGAHAWRFISLEVPGLYIEFLEFRGGDPRAEGAFAELLGSLEALGTGQPEEWRAAPPEPSPAEDV